MDFIPKPLDDYCSSHTTAETELLKQLNRDTHAHVLQPRMLSGHFQGRLLSMISHMIKPTFILEIGTYTGYSALCLAEGLAQNGKLITIDINPEQEERINRYITAAGKSNQIQFIVGDAYNILKTLPHTFDLIFIDADKPNYAKYYEQALEKLRTGGFVLLDNMLWSGKVLNEQEREKDKDTKTLHALNAFIQQDERVENILLPIRDGLMLVRKKP
jgi:predicted O-methyltransferase YrrM